MLKLGRSFAYSDNKEIEMYGEFLRKEIKKEYSKKQPKQDIYLTKTAEPTIQYFSNLLKS